MSKLQKHNVILIGFMGSGKTSVGKALANRLMYRFLDSDQVIEERTLDSISHIFSTHGEEYFRNLETDTLKDISSGMNQTVLSTGGGLPLREQNSKLLKEMGFVVFLKASKETTLKRLKGDTTRPLLNGTEVGQKVEQMIKSRSPIYESVAHKIIATDGRSIEEVVNFIMEAYLKQIY